MEVLDTGFAQDKEDVWVAALVRGSTEAVGHEVTVNFNLLDTKGEILESQGLFGYISWEGQELVISNSGMVATLESAKQKVASIEVDVAVSEDAEGTEPPVVPTVGPVRVNRQFAHVEVSNPGETPMPGVETAVLCRDASGEITTGGSEWVDLVPRHGRAKVSVYLMSGQPRPASCKAYVVALADE